MCPGPRFVQKPGSKLPGSRKGVAGAKLNLRCSVEGLLTETVSCTDHFMRRKQSVTVTVMHYKGNEIEGLESGLRHQGTGSQESLDCIPKRAVPAGGAWPVMG